jgi:hypothetical protein
MPIQFEANSDPGIIGVDIPPLLDPFRVAKILSDICQPDNPCRPGSGEF